MLSSEITPRHGNNPRCSGEAEKFAKLDFGGRALTAIGNTDFTAALSSGLSRAALGGWKRQFAELQNAVADIATSMPEMVGRRGDLDADITADAAPVIGHAIVALLVLALFLPHVLNGIANTAVDALDAGRDVVGLVGYLDQTNTTVHGLIVLLPLLVWLLHQRD